MPRVKKYSSRFKSFKPFNRYPSTSLRDAQDKRSVPDV